jgi:hypothetical protein
MNFITTLKIGFQKDVYAPAEAIGIYTQQQFNNVKRGWLFEKISWTCKFPNCRSEKAEPTLAMRVKITGKNKKKHSQHWKHENYCGYLTKECADYCADLRYDERFFADEEPIHESHETEQTKISL